MKLYKVLAFTVLFSSFIHSQFKGEYGLYALGGAGKSMPASIIEYPFVNGAVIRFEWGAVEKSPGIFDWSYVDQELNSVKMHNKKACLQPLGVPSWIKDSLHAAVYYYIDQNTYHPTYGDTLFSYIPWDEIYLDRLEKFIVEMGNRYSKDTSVSYVNSVSGSISRRLPDKVADGRNFWEVYSYNPDSLVSKLIRVLKVYMNSFPNTPLWSSMDYITFEKKASGENTNYVCGKYADYGVENYPGSFGVWREDISGCTIYPPIPTSQWAVIQKYSERSGAQMLWSVQDGAQRMNQCGLPDSSKAGVMKAALDKGLLLGMRYFEIYTSDLIDASLQTVFTDYADSLKEKGITTRVGNHKHEIIPADFMLKQNYPNPFNPSTTIRFQIPADVLSGACLPSGTDEARITLKVYNVLGCEVATLVNERKSSGIHEVEFDASNLPSGVYIYRIMSDRFKAEKKMLLLK